MIVHKHRTSITPTERNLLGDEGLVSATLRQVKGSLEEALSENSVKGGAIIHVTVHVEHKIPSEPSLDLRVV